MLKRIVAAALAGLLALPPAAVSAAAPKELAAEPVPVVILPTPPARSHVGAWITLAAGAGLLGGSFVLHDRANRSYRDYLESTDPDRLDTLYDRATSLDRLSGGALIGGELLLATGVYLRFLRSSGAARLSLAVRPGRVAAQWRF
ncbi:MAG: hypothetical protein ABIS67_14195 [Candidatus Eisenbacteria bacterium]